MSDPETWSVYHQCEICGKTGKPGDVQDTDFGRLCYRHFMEKYDAWVEQQKSPPLPWYTRLWHAIVRHF